MSVIKETFASHIPSVQIIKSVSNAKYKLPFREEKGLKLTNPANGSTIIQYI